MRRTAITCALTVALALLSTANALANVNVTTATGGTNISADVAQNGVTPAFTTLGNIVIAKTGSGKGDFGAGTNVTLILTAPSGWSFNAGVGSVTFTSLANISNASIAVTSSNLTVTMTVVGTNKLDTLTISNVQVRATDGGNVPASGIIPRTSANPGTATITGISNDSTSFGSLSQAVGALRLYVVLPGQNFTDAATLAGSGISGTPSNQTAGAAFTITKLVAADQEFNTITTYSGAKTISYSGPGGSPTYTTGVSFTGGQSTTPLTTTLRKAETTTITVTDGTNPGVASSSLTVNPGAVSGLQVLVPGETAAPGTATGKSGSTSTQMMG